MKKSLLTVSKNLAALDAPITPKAKKTRNRIETLKGTSPTPDVFEMEDYRNKEEDCKTPVNRKGKGRFRSSSPSNELEASPGLLLSSQADCGVTWDWGPNRSRRPRQARLPVIPPSPEVIPINEKELPKDSPSTSKPKKSSSTPKGFEKFRLGLRMLYDDNKANDGKRGVTNTPKDNSSDSIDFNGSSDSDGETITKSLPNIDKVCTNLNSSFLGLATTTTENDNSIRKVKSSHNFDTKNDLLDLDESDEDFDFMLIKATQEAEQEVAHNWKRELPSTPKRRRSSIAAGMQHGELSFDDSINEFLSNVPIDVIVSKAYENTNKIKQQTTPLRHSSMPVSPQILKPLVSNKSNLLQRHISLPPKQDDQKNVVEQPKMVRNYTMSSESVNSTSTINSTSSASPHRICTKEEIEQKRLAAKKKLEERKRRLAEERKELNPQNNNIYMKK